MFVVEEIEEKVDAREAETKDVSSQDTQHLQETVDETDDDIAFEEFVISAKLGRELTADERTKYKQLFLQDISAEERAKFKEKAMLKKTGPASQAPAPAPEFKLSQLVPMVALLGCSMCNFEELGNARYIEIAFVVVQLLCLGILYLIYTRINSVPPALGHCKVKVPEGIVSPAKEQTAKEYDMDKLREAMRIFVVVFVILGGIYYKWGSLMPLVMQMLIMPVRMYEAPLTQIYLFGKVQKRPFGSPSRTDMETTKEQKKSD